MAKAQVIRQITPNAYIIQTDVWDQLPEITKNGIKKRIAFTFMNLLQVKVVREEDIPKALHLVDSVIYLWREEEDQIDALVNRQCTIARTHSNIGRIEIAADPARGREMGCSVKYKERCEDGQGNPARVSITLGGIYVQSIINEYEGPQPHYPSDQLRDQPTDRQKYYGIVFGNYISHEIRHQYFEPHATQQVGGLGVSGLGAVDKSNTSFTTAATRAAFSFSKRDFKDIKNKIREYQKLDQDIPTAIETR